MGLDPTWVKPVLDFTKIGNHYRLSVQIGDTEIECSRYKASEAVVDGIELVKEAIEEEIVKLQAAVETIEETLDCICHDHYPEEYEVDPTV